MCLLKSVPLTDIRRMYALRAKVVVSTASRKKRQSDQEYKAEVAGSKVKGQQAYSCTRWHE